MSTQEHVDSSEWSSSPAGLNAHRAAAASTALSVFKIALGLVIIVRSATADVDVVPSVVQTGAYLVVCVAVVLQRRVGLAISAAFLGYSMVVGLQEFGFSDSYRVLLFTSTALLTVALLVNTAMPVKQTTLSVQAWLPIALTGLVGAILGVLIPLDVVDPDSAAPEQVGPSAFMPDIARRQMGAALGSDDEGEELDCLINGVLAEFDMPTVMSWQADGPSAAERERIASISEHC